MTDKPVKQANAADYLGVDKSTIRDLIANHGVRRDGLGEGKVIVSECFRALMAKGVTCVCPTCGNDMGAGKAVPDGS